MDDLACEFECAVRMRRNNKRERGHMKDQVEVGHLIKYDAFRLNRDEAMNLEIWFKIHTSVSNFETASPKIM